MLPCRLFISQHPEVEARIVEELRGLGLLATPQQPQPRALEHADLSKLIYLSCAVKVRQLGGAFPLVVWLSATALP